MAAAPGSTPQELSLLQSLADSSTCLVVHLPSGAQLLLCAEAPDPAAAAGEGGAAGQVRVRAVLVKPGAQRQQQQQQQQEEEGRAGVKQEPPTSGA
jgi:membrane protein involved in colicin uptake